MKPIITKVGNIFDHLNDALAVFAAALLVFLMLSVTYAVILRYFMDLSIKGILEIWEYIVLYIPFLGAAWLLKREGHVGVDIVLHHLKPKAQAMLNIITSILAAIACLALTVYGTKASWRSFQAGYRIAGGELLPPEFLVLMVIPIGSFLLFIQFLRRINRHSANWQAIPKEEEML